MSDQERREFEADYRKRHGHRLYCESEWRGWQARAALEHQAVPEGFALAPVEPNTETQVAGFESEAWDALIRAVLAKKGWPYSCRQSAECVSAIYRAMLAAAPAAPAAPQAEKTDSCCSLSCKCEQQNTLSSTVSPQAEQQAGRRNRKEDQLIYSVLLPGWQKGEPLTQIAERVADALAAQQAEREPMTAQDPAVEAEALAIERDEEMDRDYIPLPGGWELQTKGKGSTLRLLDKKAGERHPLPLPNFVIQFIERMAREVNAASKPPVQGSES